MEQEYRPFFRPHTGDLYDGVMVLLSTTACAAHKDECPHWTECTGTGSEPFDVTCPHPCCTCFRHYAPTSDYPAHPAPQDDSGDEELYPVPLSETLLYYIDVFVNDLQKRYDGEDNDTYDPLLDAIGTALGLDYEASPRFRRNVLRFISINEYAQRFTKQVKTEGDDFKDIDYRILKQTLLDKDVHTLITHGKPSFNHILRSFRDEYGEDCFSLVSDDGYLYELNFEGRHIRVYRCNHPSYGGYWDDDGEGKSRLVPRLTEAFRDMRKKYHDIIIKMKEDAH